MVSYVALLRGINVGGNNIIPMAAQNGQEITRCRIPESNRPVL